MKKLLSLILVGVIAASVLLQVGAVSVNDFSDMPDDWSTPALTAAVENGLLTGSDGLILPKDNLTRAQMATIIVRAFGAVSADSLDGFTDVPSDKWYYEYMQKAVAMGVFTGDGTGLLTPDNNITREQVFAVLARAFKLDAGDASVLNKFADKDSISDWAKGYAAALVENGYVNGSDDGTGKLYLNPKNNITRAEFAQIMYNMIKYYVDSPETLDDEYEGSVIVRISGVKITKSAVITGNLVICEGVTDITIDDSANIGNIIDNRKVVPEDTTDNETTGVDKEETKEEDKEEIFWVTPVPDEEEEDDSSDDTTTGDSSIGSDVDNEGWSPIYRP